MIESATVCVPLTCETFEDVINYVKDAEQGGADLVEIWLDSLPFTYGKSRKDQKLMNELCGLIDLPILCVNKAGEEKGSCGQPEAERVGLLAKAVMAGVDYIDVGIHTDPELVQLLVDTIEEQGGMTQLIISYHNFETTPPHEELEEIVNQAKERGADVVKIATYATSESDNQTLFTLLDFIQQQGIRGIVVCMGGYGKASRIHATEHGSIWTYAALDENLKTAPGQITLKEFKECIAS